MIKPLMSVIEVGDFIGTAGCYIYSGVIIIGTIICMIKYLKVDE